MKFTTECNTHCEAMKYNLDNTIKGKEKTIKEDLCTKTIANKVQVLQATKGYDNTNNTTLEDIYTKEMADNDQLLNTKENAKTSNATKMYLVSCGVLPAFIYFVHFGGVFFPIVLFAVNALLNEQVMLSFMCTKKLPIATSKFWHENKYFNTVIYLGIVLNTFSALIPVTFYLNNYRALKYILQQNNFLNYIHFLPGFLVLLHLILLCVIKGDSKPNIVFTLVVFITILYSCYKLESLALIHVIRYFITFSFIYAATIHIHRKTKIRADLYNLTWLVTILTAGLGLINLALLQNFAAFHQSKGA